jgi:hypothetical protein
MKNRSNRGQTIRKAGPSASLRYAVRVRFDEVERPLQHPARAETPAAFRSGNPSSRASTSFLRTFSWKDVDGRDEPGHDSK